MRERQIGDILMTFFFKYKQQRFEFSQILYALGSRYLQSLIRFPPSFWLKRVRFPGGEANGQGRKWPRNKNLGSVFHQGKYCCVPSCRWQKRLLPKHPLASRLEAKGFFAYKRFEVSSLPAVFFLIFFCWMFSFWKMLIVLVGIKEGFQTKTNPNVVWWAKIKLKPRKEGPLLKLGCCLATGKRFPGCFQP